MMRLYSEREVFTAVYAVYRLDKVEIQSPSRNPRLVEARRAYTLALRWLSGFSFPQIAEHVRGKGTRHSTIWDSHRYAKEALTTKPEFRERMDTIMSFFVPPNLLEPVTIDGKRLVPDLVMHDDRGKPESVRYRVDGVGAWGWLPIAEWYSHDKPKFDEDGA